MRWGAQVLPPPLRPHISGVGSRAGSHRGDGAQFIMGSWSCPTPPRSPHLPVWGDSRAQQSRGRRTRAAAPGCPVGSAGAQCWAHRHAPRDWNGPIPQHPLNPGLAPPASSRAWDGPVPPASPKAGTIPFSILQIQNCRPPAPVSPRPGMVLTHPVSPHSRSSPPPAWNGSAPSIPRTEDAPPPASPSCPWSPPASPESQDCPPQHPLPSISRAPARGPPKVPAGVPKAAPTPPSPESRDPPPRSLGDRTGGTRCSHRAATLGPAALYGAARGGGSVVTHRDPPRDPARPLRVCGSRVP